MSADTVLQLAHGGGGRLTRELIENMIVPRFGSGPLSGLPDGATLPSPGDRLVFTTDSFVVQPLADVRPELVLPGTAEPVRKVLADMTGNDDVRLFAERW